VSAAHRPLITVLDGSLGGAEGNTAAVGAGLFERLGERAALEHVHLGTDTRSFESLTDLLDRSAGFVFTTGVYWGSWGSPMQRFLEQATPLEASEVWLGKPAAVLVTMHSAGGEAVLTRLQGVLSMLGLLLPPMSGFAYSMATHLCLRHAPPENVLDFWDLPDLEVLAHNLMQGVEGGRDFRAWTVDKDHAGRRWF
jgi:hypothetical protein